MRWKRLFAALLVASSLSGCLSIADASHDKGPRPFGGVRLWSGDGGSGYQSLFWLTIVAPLVDIPLCLIFDVVALPVTLLIHHNRAPKDTPPEPPPPKKAPRSSSGPRKAPRPKTPSAIFSTYPDLQRFESPQPKAGVLGAGVYAGDLRVGPSTLEAVRGAGIGKTVIDGDLLVVGRGKSVSDLTVLGNVQVSGVDVDLSRCELKGKVRSNGVNVSLPPGTAFEDSRGQTRVGRGHLEPRRFVLDANHRVELRVSFEGPSQDLPPTRSRLRVINIGEKAFSPVIEFAGPPRMTIGWMGELRVGNAQERWLKTGAVTWGQLRVRTRERAWLRVEAASGGD